jgi:hypothetical protein
MLTLMLALQFQYIIKRIKPFRNLCAVFFFYRIFLSLLFISTLFNTGTPSFADSKIPLLQLWHWQSDALTTGLDLIHSRLDLIHNSARSHPR